MGNSAEPWPTPILYEKGGETLLFQQYLVCWLET